MGPIIQLYTIFGKYEIPSPLYVSTPKYFNISPGGGSSRSPSITFKGSENNSQNIHEIRPRYSIMMKFLSHSVTAIRRELNK